MGGGGGEENTERERERDLIFVANLPRRAYTEGGAGGMERETERDRERQREGERDRERFDICRQSPKKGITGRNRNHQITSKIPIRSSSHAPLRIGRELGTK